MWGQDEGRRLSLLLYFSETLLYTTQPPPHSPCPPLFLLRHGPHHQLDVPRVPRSPREVSSPGSESALLERQAHGGCPITLSGGWLERSRPWQAAPERTPRGAGKTRSSRVSAVTAPSCFRAAKENFYTISILVGAMNHLTRASRHCPGHCGKRNAFRQLLILTSL